MVDRVIRAVLLGGLLLLAREMPAARIQTPGPDDLIAWLDTPGTQWLATARLQEVPEAAMRALLQPGRITSTGPHGEWTAPMLALAKLGPEALPAIRARALEVLASGDPRTYATVDPLVKVLEALGPSAVPVLVDLAEASAASPVTTAALEAIVRLEPRRETFGQLLSPWAFWRPVDDRLNELQRAVVPLLPRVLAVMERGAAAWNPRQSPQPQRPAAYLVARWGAGEVRQRGVAVLQDLASAKNTFHAALEAIRLLHALKSPDTEALIRGAATHVPDYGDLKGSYLLLLAVGLHQLGERDYAPLLTAALSDRRPEVRMDVARFVATSGHAAHARLLLPLLDDRAEWDRRTVADVAHESLRRLTLADVPQDRSLWQQWLDRRRDGVRKTWLARWVDERRASIGRVPRADADRWLRQLEVSDGVIAFPLVDAYLRRSDLDVHGISGGGGGPAGAYGPAVVTLLLGMVQRAVPGARARLERCLTSSSAVIRIYAALALAAYDRTLAAGQLAIEVTLPDGGYRDAGVFLLQLGDSRGFPERLDRLGSDHGATRQLACRDLRMYTQQAISCDVGDTAPARAANVAAWRMWWDRNGRTVRVKVREAELDSLAYPIISPISIGDRTVR